MESWRHRLGRRETYRWQGGISVGAATLEAPGSLLVIPPSSRVPHGIDEILRLPPIMGEMQTLWLASLDFERQELLGCAVLFVTSMVVQAEIYKGSVAPCPGRAYQAANAGMEKRSVSLTELRCLLGGCRDIIMSFYSQAIDVSISL